MADDPKIVYVAVRPGFFTEAEARALADAIMRALGIDAPQRDTTGLYGRIVGTQTENPQGFGADTRT